jgi:hypothetical protein
MSGEEMESIKHFLRALKAFCDASVKEESFGSPHDLKRAGKHL